MKHSLTCFTALLLAPLAALRAADKSLGDFRQLVRTETWTEKWPDASGKARNAQRHRRSVERRPCRRRSMRKERCTFPHGNALLSRWPARLEIRSKTQRRSERRDSSQARQQHLHGAQRACRHLEHEASARLTYSSIRTSPSKAASGRRSPPPSPITATSAANPRRRILHSARTASSSCKTSVASR